MRWCQITRKNRFGNLVNCRRQETPYRSRLRDTSCSTNENEMDFIFLSLIFGAAVLFLVYLIKCYTYWNRRGIPSAKGLIPLLGNLLPVVTLRMNFPEYCRKLYTDYKDYSMVGLYKITSPVLLIREPELVKTVMQTNFVSFHENSAYLNPDLDPLPAKNPFFCYGDAWVTGRKRLTYAFSSMRLKILCDTVREVCKKFDSYLERRLKSNHRYEVELKALFSKFTGEVVANAGLGVEGHCFDDEPRGMTFDEMGNSFLQPSLINGLKQAITFFLPQLSKPLRVKVIPEYIDNFFRTIVKEILETRKTESVPRKDFLQLMIDLQKTEGEEINEEDLASHALSFFMDGFETSSLTLGFIGYQLAVHLHIQKKLREEILSVLSKHGGEMTYEALKEMTYMDQVISESQRCYPAAGALAKRCTDEFELKGSDGLRCRVKPGTEIIIPLHGLQTDPKYWTDPVTFDPERFNAQRKQSIEKFTFLPFGEGPRMCVGMRMGLLQIKACLAFLLSKYTLELSPKTQIPLKLSASHFLTAAEGGLWVFIKRI